MAKPKIEPKIKPEATSETTTYVGGRRFKGKIPPAFQNLVPPKHGGTKVIEITDVVAKPEVAVE